MPEHPDADPAPRLSAIFGASRSGTTWLGSIVNSHPRVAYRFEPFHRLGDHRRIAAVREMIREGDLRDARLPEIYHALLPAHPALDKVPFFHKDNAPLRGKTALWAVSRKLPLMAPLMERIYTPRDRPPLVFKEVDLQRLMIRLIERTSMPVVYIVRHPAAYAASAVRGQQRGLMPTFRITNLADLLRENAPPLAERFAPRIDDLTPAARNALLWRFELETVWPALQSPHVLILIYEDLCTSPMDRSEDVLRFLDLEMTDQTRRFIARSTGKGDAAPDAARADRMVNDYFTVYRDPTESMSRWKDELTDRDRRDIDHVLDGCEVFQTLAKHGFWS